MKLIPLVFVIFVIVLIVAAVMVFPLIVKERTCYDTAFESVGALRMRASILGTDTKEICRLRVETLADFRDCIQTVEQSSRLAVTMHAVVSFGAQYDHPLSKTFDSITADHNTQCAEYKQYILQ
jgi:nitrate/nitrite-specific signal transduction histidine kinase